jgi:hypothetical protein
VAPETQAGIRYASQVGELWGELSQALARLEAIALAPERLDEDETVGALRRLQYRLHLAGESVLGLSPPAGAEPAHTELAAALASARDATGEIAGVVDEQGGHGARPLLYEWRGALFRVRLARLRLTGEQPSPAPPRPRLPGVRLTGVRLTGIQAPVAASALTIAGTATFAIGATLGPWPLWVAGLLAVCLSLVLYRP